MNYTYVAEKSRILNTDSSFGGDTTDGILSIILGISLLSCGATIILSALFPCSCRPRRDCRRNCSDCAKDRQRCRQKWYDCCTRRQRADTEEELVPAV